MTGLLIGLMIGRTTCDSQPNPNWALTVSLGQSKRMLSLFRFKVHDSNYVKICLLRVKTLHPRPLLIKCLFYSNSLVQLVASLEFQLERMPLLEPKLASGKNSKFKILLMSWPCQWKMFHFSNGIDKAGGELVKEIINSTTKSQLTIISGRPWALKQRNRSSWVCICSWLLWGLVR